MAVESGVADTDAHAAHALSIGGDGDAAQQSFLAEGAIVVVHQQITESRVAGQENVGPTVLVHVERDRGEAVRTGEGADAGFFGDIGEGAVAVVAEKILLQRRHAHGATVDGQALVIAVGNLHRRLRAMDQVDVEVIGDEQVEQAVAIALDERASGGVANAWLQEPGLFCHVGEGAVAVVTVEAILAVAGDEEVVEAIVVVIADADTHGPARLAEAGFLGDVGEGAVAVVLVESIAGPGRNAVQAATGEQENIHPSIVVVVDEGAAGAHDFEDVGGLFVLPVEGGVGESGGGAHVNEARKRRGGCRCGAHAAGQERRGKSGWQGAEQASSRPGAHHWVANWVDVLSCAVAGSARQPDRG